MAADDTRARSRILVVDDQELMRLSLEETLGRAGYAVTTADRGADALEAVEAAEFDAVVTDLKMPGMDGLDLVRRLGERSARRRECLPVVVITAHGSIETAVEAMRRGAFDYVQKPFEPDEIELVVGRAVEHRRLACQNQGLRDSLAGSADSGHVLVGSSPSLAALRRQIEQVAASSATVLVHGESGTGKELVSRAIHAQGPRSGEVFLCVNCAALSAGLLESELFGHEKGAFTGADRMRVGRFELADGGTLLLDEVSEIDLALQAKLLRVLQEGRFERVGSSATRPADVRVIATTNRDLAEAVRDGAFRRDLYFRLNVLPVHVPPLRDHADDLPDLVDHLLDRHAGDARSPMTVAPETITLLKGYRWPGNVRELENIIRRALVMGFGEVLRPEHIRGWLDNAPVAGRAGLPGNMTLAEVERAMVTAALERHNGNRTRAAGDLGISPRTLRDKLARWRTVRVVPASEKERKRA